MFAGRDKDPSSVICVLCVYGEAFFVIDIYLLVYSRDSLVLLVLYLLDVLAVHRCDQMLFMSLSFAKV